MHASQTATYVVRRRQSGGPRAHDVRIPQRAAQPSSFPARSAPGVVPVQRLKARRKLLTVVKPSVFATWASVSSVERTARRPAAVATRRGAPCSSSSLRGESGAGCECWSAGPRASSPRSGVLPFGATSSRRICPPGPSIPTEGIACFSQYCSASASVAGSAPMTFASSNDASNSISVVAAPKPRCQSGRIRGTCRRRAARDRQAGSRAREGERRGARCPDARTRRRSLPSRAPRTASAGFASRMVTTARSPVTRQRELPPGHQ